MPRPADPAALETDTVDLPILRTVGGETSALLAFGGGVLVCAIAIGILALTRRRRRDKPSNG